VVAQEPVPPSRLNPTVPRDLETICLTCLHKEPRRRYPSAAALRSDLQRFLDGRPIAARPVGRPERVVRWMRRNPTATALIGTTALLAGLALAAGLRERELVVRQRADLAKWTDRLAFVHRLQEEARFAEARAILREADPGSADLQSQIEQARANLDLAERLDALRLRRSPLILGRGLDYAASSRQYEAIFREAGLGDLRKEPELVAQRLAASPIRRALIAALDDWATCADRAERDEILRMARTVDDPDPWRDRVRDADGWDRVETFPDLANTADVRAQPVTLLVAFGTRWCRLGGDPTSFLERVQRRYPNDFWVNLELGSLLAGRDVAAAVGYCRAAVAARPNAALGHVKLGLCLAKLGRHDEAIHHYQRALEISPDDTWVQWGLTLELAAQGRTDKASGQSRQGRAAEPYPPGFLVMSILSNLRNQQGRVAEPDRPGPRRESQQALLRAGRLEEARAEWRRSLDAGSSAYDWNGYAELCLFLGQEDEYCRARQVLLGRFATTSDPFVAERTARVCLLRPLSGDELRQVVALAERAADAARLKYRVVSPYFLFTQGLADYRQGRFDRAVAAMRGEAGRVLGPAPGLVLAMALQQSGQAEEARKTLAAAIRAHDWSAEKARDQDGWIYHVLRREAERLVQ
jgi:serine/threonine-protein kinase